MFTSPLHHDFTNEILGHFFNLKSSTYFEFNSTRRDITLNNI